ncbi:MAG: DUF342 domain-containing protein [Desulfamplus sp.]|nr:DUF342 domain-containing protein [Desulfamplus sp.]
MTDINTITGLGLSVGELAVKHSFITETDLEKAMRLSADLENGYDAIPEYLVAQNLISQKDCDRFFSLAKAMAARGKDIKFGTLAIKKGFITQSMLELALNEQKTLLKNRKKYALLGNILVEAGMLTPQQRDEILSEQNRYNSDGTSKDKETDDADSESKHSYLHDPSKESFARSETFSDSGIRLIIKGDGNAAYLLKIEGFNKDISIGQIKEILASRNIIHGIVDNNFIQKFINSDVYLNKPFKIAEGNAPIEGKNASVQYFFTKNRLKAGTIREDGTIDFRERGNIPQVEKGSVLAIKKNAVVGLVGKNIFNDTVRVNPTKDIRLKVGKGAILSSDKLKVIAAVSGHPKLGSDGTIHVYDTFVVQGNVDFNTGNIDYQGDVTVKGCILNGFTVKGHNVKAEEIDGATVIAQGNVVVEQGINESKISAQGSLSAKFIQKSTISCIGDVKSDKEIVESTIECSGTCNIRGIIISSKIAAKMGLYAKQIGMEKSPPSTIRVGVDSFALRTVEKFQNGIDEKKEANKKLLDTITSCQQEIKVLEDKIVNLNLIKEQLEEDRIDILSKIADIEGKNEGRASEIKLQQSRSDLKQIVKNIAESSRKIVLCHENVNSIRQSILEAEEQIKANQAESASFQKERDTLIDWIDKNQGIPVIKVDEYIMANTRVYGRYSEDIIKSTAKGVVIREDQVSRSNRDIWSKDKDSEATLWRLYVTKM